MTINFHNVSEDLKIDIKKTVDLFFDEHHLNPDASVEISLVDKDQIHRLNQEFRQNDQATDVLSFPVWKNIEDIPKKGVVNLGEIFICPDLAQDNIDFLVEHSLNHLIGKHH